ncbi:MAG: hypothetical protein NTZ84_01755 [Candidatus Nealsonbacteria bacterium]|nr:hypothetical protein [Candidatus Nealsonbacteria bacterium]
MTDSSIFQILGLTYLAIGLGMLTSPRFYKEMLIKMIDNEAVLFVTGLLVFVIGYFFVAYHNIWTGGRTIIITIFGWLALLKGLMMIVIPEKSVKLYNLIKISEGQLGVYGVIVFVLGVILAYFGYFAL